MIIKSAEKTIRISEQLNSYGFYVPAIRPPTVPNESSRLRISISALHSQLDIKKLTKVLNKLLTDED